MYIKSLNNPYSLLVMFTDMILSEFAILWYLLSSMTDCHHKGVVYRAGQSFSPDNCRTCWCMVTGKLSCSESSCHPGTRTSAAITAIQSVLAIFFPNSWNSIFFNNIHEFEWFYRHSMRQCFISFTFSVLHSDVTWTNMMTSMTY
jgi:hypothetical protein